MERDHMWCPRCERMISPRVSINYPMTIGILGVLAAISFVFVWVTFLDRTIGTPETVVLTMIVTVLPFCYMRLRRMQATMQTCPLCSSLELTDAPPQSP